MDNVKVGKGTSYVGNIEVLDISIFRKVGVQVYAKIRNYCPDLYNYFYEADIPVYPSNLDIDLMNLEADPLTLKKYLVLLVFNKDSEEIPLSIKRISRHSTLFSGNTLKSQPLNVIYILIIVVIIAIIICVYLFIFGAIDAINNSIKYEELPNYNFIIYE